MEIYEQINDYSNGWSQFSGQCNKLKIDKILAALE